MRKRTQQQLRNERYSNIIAYSIVFNTFLLDRTLSNERLFFTIKTSEIIGAYIWRVLEGRDSTCRYVISKYNMIINFEINADGTYTLYITSSAADIFADILRMNKKTNVRTAFSVFNERLEGDALSGLQKHAQEFFFLLQSVEIECTVNILMLSGIQNEIEFSKRYNEALQQKVLD